MVRRRRAGGAELQQASLVGEKQMLGERRENWGQSTISSKLEFASESWVS